nr:hypothetical protein [Pseudomonas simiae]
MRNRGSVYWDWADPALHARSVDERLSDGTLLNIHVRMSALGATQLFIGVYGVKGMMLFEEAFDARSGETMTQAMKWGLERGRAHAPASSIEKPTKPESLPRLGSKQNK